MIMIFKFRPCGLVWFLWHISGGVLKLLFPLDLCATIIHFGFLLFSIILVSCFRLVELSFTYLVN